MTHMRRPILQVRRMTPSYFDLENLATHDWRFWRQ